MPDDERDQRTRRRRRLGSAVTVLVVLGGVAAVAWFTGSSPHPGTPPAGATRGGVLLPDLVFADAADGYAFYPECFQQVLGEGCLPSLFHTTDTGRHWTRVVLPVGLPTETGLWGQRLQVHGDDLLLSWTFGSVVSDDAGATWQPTVVKGATPIVPAGGFVLDQQTPDDGTQQLVVDPATGATRQLEISAAISPEATSATMTGSRLWIQDAHTFLVSSDRGKTWQSAPAAKGAYLDELLPAEGSPGLTRLVASLEGDTSGQPGDGGEFPARQVLVSSDAGTTWRATRLTGPTANVLCSVVLRDGSVLGVGTDGLAVLRLPAGHGAFSPVTNGPRATPYCLSANASMVYGPTFGTTFAYTVDGTTWQSGDLPPVAGPPAT